MSETKPTRIDADTTITGRLDQGRAIEVYGTVEGELSADAVVIHPGGTVIGKLEARMARILGNAQGEIRIKTLIDIGATGDVSGKVQYGQLALAPGGRLEATVHNVPPTMTGDLDLTVTRGKAVTITTKDLNAVDPDDDAKDLTFSITSPANGWIALRKSPATPVTKFTQADLLAKDVAFVHDGTPSESAGFQVSLADNDGATAGAPKRVTITVRPAA